MVEEDYPALALRVSTLSLMIFKLTRKDLERRLKRKRISISIPAIVVMRYVRHGPSTIRELSDHMMITPATLVPVVDALEKKGLVRRGTDRKDRRRNPISLTAKGAALLSSIPLVNKEGALVKSLRKMGARKSRRLADSLEELASMLAGSDDICRRISETAKNEPGEGRPFKAVTR